jgi:hypothetical protein
MPIVFDADDGLHDDEADSDDDDSDSDSDDEADIEADPDKDTRSFDPLAIYASAATLREQSYEPPNVALTSTEAYPSPLSATDPLAAHARRGKLPKISKPRRVTASASPPPTPPTSQLPQNSTDLDELGFQPNGIAALGDSQHSVDNLWKKFYRIPLNKTSWNFCGSMRLPPFRLKAAGPTLRGDLSATVGSRLSWSKMLLPAVSKKVDEEMSTQCASKALQQPVPTVKNKPQPPKGARDVQTRWSHALNGRPLTCAARVQAVLHAILPPDLLPAAKRSRPTRHRPGPSSASAHSIRWAQSRYIQAASLASPARTTEAEVVPHLVTRV